jgi:hypothetical protein
VSTSATSCPKCGYPIAQKKQQQILPYQKVELKSDGMAGCLGLLLGPVGLWYKGCYGAGFAWLIFAIIFAVATSGISIPFFWIGMAAHAAWAKPKY